MSSRYINVFIYQSAEGNKSTKNKKRSFESCTAQYNVDVIFMTNTRNNARTHTRTERERSIQSSRATEKIFVHLEERWAMGWEKLRRNSTQRENVRGVYLFNYFAAETARKHG